MNERDLGWLEGIIDGEGCLGLYSSPYKANNNHPGHVRWLPLLTITNTNTAIINRARAIIGYGSIAHRNPVHEGDKPFYHYAVGANGLRYILPKLKLTAKESQRLLLLEALSLVSSKTHTRWNGVPNDKRMHELFAESKRLNKRGTK